MKHYDRMETLDKTIKNLEIKKIFEIIERKNKTEKEYIATTAATIIIISNKDNEKSPFL